MKRISEAERAGKALELRKAGASLQEIADRLGYANPSVVHKALARAIAEFTREPAEDLVAIEVMRLEAIWQTCWADLDRAKNTAERAQVVTSLLRLSERRCRMLGLDAPARHQIKAGVTATVDAELTARAARMTTDDLIASLVTVAREDPVLWARLLAEVEAPAVTIEAGHRVEAEARING